MNPRIRYSTESDRFTHTIDGAEFPYVMGNEASREAALAKLNEHGTKVIAALEQFAGRTLSDRELMRGITPREDRTPSERVAESTAKAREQRPAASPDNPYQAALDMGLGKTNRKESKQKMYERLAAEHEAKKQAATAAAEFASDPKRVAAVEHAAKELAALKFDTSATVSEVKAAEARLVIARTGEISAYREADKAWREQKRAKIDEQTNGVDQQIAALRSQREAILNRSFEMPEPPAPEPTPNPIPVMSEADYEASRAKTIANDATRAANDAARRSQNSKH